MTRSDRVPVGIVSAGMYLPTRVVTAAEIAKESGIEEWVIREKFGIVAAGVGDVWSAACVKRGLCESRQDGSN